MKRIRSRWLRSIGILIFMLILACWLHSPYKRHAGFPYRLIEHTVEIDASADSVFSFLGNSRNAARWSVFEDHISTLNATEVRDGKVGSVRRCYCRPDENGMQWDEIVTQVLPAQKRQIYCYNMVDFAISSEGLATEQLYQRIGKDKCRLTFTLFYSKPQPSLSDKIKIRFAAFRVKHIFRRNMNNIKRIIETGA